MSVVDPIWAGVAELSRAFETRALSPVDVVDALLARIRTRDALHAYIVVYADEARLAAEAADRAIKSGHRVGPLHGIPIGLKDLIDLEGRVTTGGSKVWIDRVSPLTATLAQRLIAAGMIVLGKTHTVEFAMGSFGTNTHLGTPWNPWDLAVHRTPGGSSSGWRPSPSAPTPAARCACPPRGAASSGSRSRWVASAPTACCRWRSPSTRRDRWRARSRTRR
jgi:aspartyl-tRNA(Asn)/glutamyl-tRNA(Gln) amidotransferase subunit A